MKRIFFLGVMLAMVCVPASAFGIQLNMSTSSGIVAGSGGTVVIDFDISGITTENLIGWVARLESSHTGVFDISVHTLLAPLDTINVPGTRVGEGLDTWNANDIGGSALPLAPTLDADAQIASVSLAYTAAGLTTAGLVDGSTVTFTAGKPGVFGGPDTAGTWSTSTTTTAFDSIETLDIVLTPEPSSALLLLAGVPFLRRRRS